MYIYEELYTYMYIYNDNKKLNFTVYLCVLF